MKDRPRDEAMAELFQQDPVYALEFLNSTLEDGEQGELLIALRQMTKVFGDVQNVAEKANLNPTQLYRTLSPTGKPRAPQTVRHPKSYGLAAGRRTSPRSLRALLARKPDAGATHGGSPHPGHGRPRP